MTPISAARAVAYAIGKLDKSLDFHKSVTGSANNVPDESTVSERIVLPAVTVSHPIPADRLEPDSALMVTTIGIGDSAVNGVVKVLSHRPKYVMPLWSCQSPHLAPIFAKTYTYLGQHIPDHTVAAVEPVPSIADLIVFTEI